MLLDRLLLDRRSKAAAAPIAAAGGGGDEEAAGWMTSDKTASASSPQITDPEGSVRGTYRGVSEVMDGGGGETVEEGVETIHA